MASRDKDECNSCGAFGTSEELDDPGFHESDCPHAIPDAEVHKVPIPSGPRPTIGMIVDLTKPGTAFDPPKLVHYNDVRHGIPISLLPFQNKVYQSAKRGHYKRLLRKAIEWAYIGLPNLRTRLLYARIEPWGA